MDKITITVEVDGKKLQAFRNLEGCTEQQIRERTDSLLDAVKKGAYKELGLEYFLVR